MTARPTLYEKIGGEPTIEKMVDDLFDKRLPQDKTTEPPVWDLFAPNVRRSERTLAKHKELFGSFIGELLGDETPKHSFDSDELYSLHQDVPITSEHFDVIANHLLASAQETCGEYGDDVVEKIGEVALELRASIVPPRNYT